MAWMSLLGGVAKELSAALRALAEGATARAQNVKYELPLKIIERLEAKRREIDGLERRVAELRNSRDSVDAGLADRVRDNELRSAQAEYSTLLAAFAAANKRAGYRD